MFSLNISVCILLGGAVGAWLRMIIVSLFAMTVPGSPVGMAFVNLAGSFLIGFLYVPLSNIHFVWLKYCIVGGLLGGFTTFSTYALDVYLLIENKKYMDAVGFAFLVPLFAILAVSGGSLLYRKCF